MRHDLCRFYCKECEICRYTKYLFCQRYFNHFPTTIVLICSTTKFVLQGLKEQCANIFILDNTDLRIWVLEVEFVAHFRLQGPDLVLGQTRFRFKTHKQIQYLHNSLDWKCKKAIIFTLDTLKLRVNSNSNSNIMMSCRPLDIIQTNRFWFVKYPARSHVWN